jgi:PAS domain S-box-containing protein
MHNWIACFKALLPAALVPALFLWTGGAPAGAAPETFTERLNPVSLTEAERGWLRMHPLIRVAQDPAWPPVEFADDEGRPSGMSEDYLSMLERQLGIRFQRVVNLSWQEAYARLRTHDIDMTTSVAVTPERRKFWAFTRPYNRIPLAIVTLSHVTYIAGMKDLQGRRVAMVEGYAINEWLRRDFPGIEPVRVASAREGLESVQRGESFAFIENMLVVGYYMAKLRMMNLKIAGETPYVNAQCMAVRKDWAPLIPILQKGLDSIPESEHERIYRKWVPIRYEHGFDYGLLWRALALFAVILAGFSLWVWRLRREIGRRKSVEADLKASEERFRSIVEFAPEPIFIHAERRFIYLNPPALKLLGAKDLEEMTGKPVLDMIDPEFHEIVNERLRILYEERRPARGLMELRFLRLDGSGVWVETAGEPIVYNGRNGALVFVRDVSERRRADQERRRFTEELERSNRELQQFAYVASHDLQEPLRMISSYLQLIERRYRDRLDQDANDFIDFAVDGANRLQALIIGLLEYSRVRTHGRPFQAVDLGKVVDMVLRDLTLQLVESGAGVEYDGLPVIMADESQMARLFQNLIANAIKFRSPGRKPLIRISFEKREGEFVFCVNDNGIGIEPQYYERIFVIFQRLHSREEYPGTGMGLSICKRIVERHGGRIWVDSQPGEGSSFCFTIPVNETVV